MTKPLLSIAIPTYNRANQLKDTLNNVLNVVEHWLSQVEIVVSDNASSDETQEVVENFKKQAGNLLRYHRNEKNVGVSKNLVSLYYRSRGEYFLFIGDDDKLYKYGFEKLMNALVTHKPSAVIQKDINFPIPREISVTFLAEHYFYKFGNAYCGVICREAAISAIESHDLKSELHKIVWPQTAIAFIAMHESLRDHKRAPLLLGEEIGHSPSNKELNILTFNYYHQTLFDLLKAANIVDTCYPQLDAKRFFRRWRNGFVKSLYILMLKHALTEDIDGQKRTLIYRQFKSLIGHKGQLLALLMIAFRKEQYIRTMLKFFLSRSEFSKLAKELQQMEREKALAKQGNLKDGVRFGNYWDAEE